MASLTSLQSVGEFGLIDRLRAQARFENPSSVIGIGDDAAQIDPQGQTVVITTDLLTEGVHFDLTFCPLKHLGYKAIAVNVSDLAAMMATPTQVTVALALGARFSVEAVEELYAGMRLACDNYGVDLIGGDTTSSHGGLTICVTAIGLVQKEQAVKRSTARENDLICVSGDLGAAYLGLQVLVREKQAFQADPEMQPELEGKEYVVERQLKPEARMDIVHELRELHLQPTSMIDVSDGLASELHHLCRQSNLGATIFSDRLPFEPETAEVANEFRLDPLTCMLNGGEDYELLFTVRPEDYEKIKQVADVSIIGHMTAAGSPVQLIGKGGSQVEIPAQGWHHF